jgi:hypothetical protein
LQLSLNDLGLRLQSARHQHRSQHDPHAGRERYAFRYCHFSPLIFAEATARFRFLP